jgi:hypothetical protein
MSPGKPARLLKLADREFRQLTGKPVTPEPTRKFRPIKIKLARLDNGWEKKRGTAIRLSAVPRLLETAGGRVSLCSVDAKPAIALRHSARAFPSRGARLRWLIWRCAFRGTMVF